MSESNITIGQKIFDNIFVLLAIGLAFPGVFYLAWGLLEIFVFNNNHLSDFLSKSGMYPSGGM